MEYARALLEQNRLLADLFSGADVAAPVPTCPGWTLLQLLRHVGRGDRWAAQIIREGDADLDPRRVEGGKPPDDEGRWLEWLHAGAGALVDTVAAVGLHAPVQTLVGTRPAEWWLRRRLHEATVHRADAAITRGAGYELASELAVDGIDEWLELLVSRPSAEGRSPLGEGRSLAFHVSVTASPGPAWRLAGTAVGIARTDDDLPSDTAVTARATDLFLAMVRRDPLVRTRPRIDGDAEVWETWLTRTPL